MEETKNIYQKLFEVKKEIGKISKDSTNPFFDSKYMDINTLLESVEPLFESKKLMLLQPIENGFVKSQIINLEDLTEQFIESSIELPNDNNPQKVGSAITYYRRYSLKSLLGIQEEDDDGNKAAKPEPIKLTEFKPSIKAWGQAITKQIELTQLKTKYSITSENEIEYTNQLNTEILRVSIDAETK